MPGCSSLVPAVRRRSRGLVTAALVAFAPLSLRPALAETRPVVLSLPSGPPGSAIFIGNSLFYWNNGIQTLYRNLVVSADPGNKLRTTLVTISSSGLDWHDIDHYFRPNGIHKYTFDDARGTVTYNKVDRLFDVAIMQDCIRCPMHPDFAKALPDTASRNAAALRKHGAEPVLFMTWAFADRPEMTAQINEVYTRAGNASKALVIPAGLAFARALAKRPDLVLHYADKRHPSPAGTYLAAATIYATLLGKSPAGIKHTEGLDPATASFLQQVAWETVVDYFGK